MKSLKLRYKELLELTQLHLLREYNLKEFRLVDPLHYALFQESSHTNSEEEKLPVISNKPPLPFASVPLPHPPLSPKLMTSLQISPPPAANLPALKDTPPQQQATYQEPFLPPLKNNKAFTLETTPPCKKNCDYQSFSRICNELFSGWQLRESIPDDQLAKRYKNAWKKEAERVPILIFSFHEDAKHLSLLKNIARAISLHYLPAKVIAAKEIEQKNDWDAQLNPLQLQLIIACDYELYLQPNLMRAYKEIPRTGEHFLNETPLLLLSDLSLYQKEPQLKSLLWRAICSALKKKI